MILVGVTKGDKVKQSLYKDLIVLRTLSFLLSNYHFQ
jgi:hypothetical protein